MTISLPAPSVATSPVPRGRVWGAEPGIRPGTPAEWRSRLAGAPGALDLPSDRPDTGEPYRAATVGVPVDAGLAAALDAAGTHPRDGWLAALGILLHRFSGQRESVVGEPVGDGAVAHHLAVDADTTFAGLVGRAGEPGPGPVPAREFAALLHPGRPDAPAFDAGIVHGADVAGWPHAGLVLLVPAGAAPRLGFDANRIDPDRAVRIADHLARLALGAVAEPDAPVGTLEMLPPAERHRVLVGFNDTAVEHTDDRPFAERVAAVAAAAPDAPALTFRRRRMTFGELDAAANRLAGELVARGVEAGGRVAAFLERSPEAVVATLAVLRAGAAVVPLDPAENDEWNAFMLRDAAPAAVVTDSGLAGRLASVRPGSGPLLVALDTDADAIAARPATPTGRTVAPEDLSHIVYTSGSTGRPKAVRATHRSLTNLLNLMPAAYDIGPDSAGTWISAPGFAVGRMEWMPFLAAGAVVHVADPVAAGSPTRVRDFLLARRATHTMLVTSTARRVCELHWPDAAPLRTMIVLGEPVRSWPDAGALPFEVAIAYGSTEVALATTGLDLRVGVRETARTPMPHRGRPAAGRPVANARLYLLDERSAPVPVGAVGEIHVAGDGVCDGYLRPSDDAGSSGPVPNPLPEEPGATLFRTGDLGRWRPNGVLEVIGRRDARTWVNGVRVEVERVEDALAGLPQVREAAVLGTPGEHGLLVAYAVPADPSSFSAESVLAALRLRLPETEVPSALVELERLPRLPNGKLDRGALPVPTTAPAPVADEANRFAPFPLTDTQQAYWVGRGDAVELGGVGCHGYWEWESGDLDAERFRRAWQRVLDRHDALRTVIDPDGTQHVLADPPVVPVPLLDLTGIDADEAERQAGEVREEMAHQLLPADRYPLWDVRLTRLPDGRTRIHLGLDLLIIDAWSYFQVLVPDLVAYYSDPDVELPPAGLRFRDYVVQTVGGMESTPEYRRARQYWTERLDDLPPAPALPRAPGPVPAGTRFTRREFRLAAPAWTALRERATAASVTQAGIVVAAFAEVLRAWSAEDRFTVNFPLFNRLPVHPDVDRVIGDFTTTSLLAIDGTGATFTERAQEVQRRLWADLEHRHFGGVAVMRELSRRAGTASHAAFPVVVTSLLGQPPRAFHTALGESVFTSTQTPQVTLDFQVSEVEGALCLSWDSVDEAFPDGMLADMFDAYTALLGRLADDAAAWTPERFALLPAEQASVRARVNDTAAPAPDVLLHTAVAEHAERRPHDTAVVAGSVRLHWAELDARVNQVGRTLRAAGSRPGELVAVVSDRGWEQVVAVHGVLAAGSAYLPIDAAVPQERLHRLLAHGEVRHVLTRSGLAGRIAWPPDVRVWCVDGDFDDADAAELEPVTTPDDLAYVIYTSGSTGDPKGVMVDHRGVANTLLDMNARVGLGTGDVCLSVSGLHFDLSVPDVVGMIMAGGTVVIPEPSENPDPERWAELVRTEGVTFWNSVPSLLEILVGHAEGSAAGDGPGDLASLRAVVLAGDWIPLDLPDRLRALAPDVAVVASGGPTETCIWSVVSPVGEVDTTAPSIPYGRPMTNQRYHVLDGRGDHRPTWVPGEIHVASDVGLARGYWRDPETTAARFRPGPDGEARCYATGDLGRYLPDGSIEILGRADFQVKIQGHRIEPGEVEAALLADPAVDRAVVVAAGSSGSGRRLAAFVTGPDPADGAEDRLRDLLAGRLPGYLVPASVTVLDAMPLTANGKVDRRTLAETGPDLRAGDQDDPPSGPVEELVAAVWEDLLEIPGCGRAEHFFRLGGNSLLATRVVARLRELSGVELPLRTIFTEPTVAGVAAALVRDPEDAARVRVLCELLAGMEDDGADDA